MTCMSTPIRQVQKYVLPRTHELASSYTFWVFRVWITWSSNTHPFLAILICGKLSGWQPKKRFVHNQFWQEYVDLQLESLVFRINWCQNRDKTRSYCRISEKKPQEICVAYAGGFFCLFLIFAMLSTCTLHKTRTLANDTESQSNNFATAAVPTLKFRHIWKWFKTICQR